MKRILGLITLIAIIYSCQKEEVIITSIPNDKNVLHVHVSYCPMINCSTALDVSDLKISLYKSLDDANAESNPIVAELSNNEGNARIVVVDQEQVFIRTDYLNKGIYISAQAIDTSKDTHHEINYKANLIYNSNDSLELRQDHISFEYPTVGQKSRYKYHHNIGEISTALPESYKTDELTVEITDQLDENTFIIKEHLIHPSTELGFYDSLHYNIWEFSEDSITIKTFDTTYTHDVFSFILGEYSWTVVNPENGLTFPFTDCSPETVDLETVNFSQVTWYLCHQVIDYVLFNTHFDQLRLHFDSWGFLDGDERLRFYNKSDGIVRYIGINQMAWRTYGFDLILE